jgi:hypothetical protein
VLGQPAVVLVGEVGVLVDLVVPETTPRHPSPDDEAVLVDALAAGPVGMVVAAHADRRVPRRADGDDLVWIGHDPGLDEDLQPVADRVAAGEHAGPAVLAGEREADVGRIKRERRADVTGTVARHQEADDLRRNPGEHHPNHLRKPLD